MARLFSFMTRGMRDKGALAYAAATSCDIVPRINNIAKLLSQAQTAGGDALEPADGLMWGGPVGFAGMCTDA